MKDFTIPFIKIKTTLKYVQRTIKDPKDRSLSKLNKLDIVSFFLNDTHLIDISAMTNRLVAFLVVHHRSSLFAVCQCIAANANNQVHVGKYVFRLEI